MGLSEAVSQCECGVLLSRKNVEGKGLLVPAASGGKLGWEVGAESLKAGQACDYSWTKW